MKKILVKYFWYFAGPVRRVYWFIIRPKTRGVKCAIQFGDKILFVHIGYGHRCWTVPGGGVKRGESFEDAVRREIFEEVGITLGEVKMFTEFVRTKEYKIDTIQCFYSRVESPDFKIDNLEIVEARWSDIDDIPKPHRPGLMEVLSYLKHVKKS